MISPTQRIDGVEKLSVKINSEVYPRALHILFLEIMATKQK